MGSHIQEKEQANTVKTLWADTLVSGQLYLLPPWQNPVWTLAHTNSVLTHSRKRPAPVADIFSASRRCPLTGASTVYDQQRLNLIHVTMWFVQWQTLSVPAVMLWFGDQYKWTTKLLICRLLQGSFPAVSQVHLGTHSLLETQCLTWKIGKCKWKQGEQDVVWNKHILCD